MSLTCISLCVCCTVLGIQSPITWAYCHLYIGWGRKEEQGAEGIFLQKIAMLAVVVKEPHQRCTSKQVDFLRFVFHLQQPRADIPCCMDLQSRVASAASAGSVVVDRAAVLAMAASSLQNTIPDDPSEGQIPSTLHHSHPIFPTKTSHEALDSHARV